MQAALSVGGEEAARAGGAFARGADASAGAGGAFAKGRDTAAGAGGAFARGAGASAGIGGVPRSCGEPWPSRVACPARRSLGMLSPMPGTCPRNSGVGMPPPPPTHGALGVGGGGFARRGDASAGAGGAFARGAGASAGAGGGSAAGGATAGAADGGAFPVAGLPGSGRRDFASARTIWAMSPSRSMPCDSRNRASDDSPTHTRPPGSCSAWSRPCRIQSPTVFGEVPSNWATCCVLYSRSVMTCSAAAFAAGGRTAPLPGGTVTRSCVAVSPSWPRCTATQKRPPRRAGCDRATPATCAVPAAAFAARGFPPPDTLRRGGPRDK